MKSIFYGKGDRLGLQNEKITTGQLRNIIAEMGNAHGISITTKDNDEFIDEPLDISYEDFIKKTEIMFVKVNEIIEQHKKDKENLK